MWLPLESNPQMLNTFLLRMGVEGVQFVDVWGLDPDLLQMVPQPCHALCLLYPCKKVNAARREMYSGSDRYKLSSPGVFYLKQHDKSGNACGTIALIHSIANAPKGTVRFAADSYLGNFIESNRGKDANEVGNALCDAKTIQSASDAEAQGGETSTPARGEAVDHHFIALSCIHMEDGMHLVELDGRLPGIVDHGIVTGDSFLLEAGKVIRDQYMAMDPESISFNVVALCSALG